MNQEQSPQTQGQDDSLLNAPVSKNMITVTVLAVIIVVLALMYVWGSNVDMRSTTTVEENVTPVSTDDVQIDALKQVGTSNEIEAIEEDLNATELENIDADFEDIETELMAQ